MPPERRHNRAKKNTVEIPVSTKAHHCQLPATPYCRTCCVTQLGVSEEKVVATIERPASHQGTLRPAAKKPVVFFDERLATKNAGRKQIRMQKAAMIQSSGERCMQ